MTAPIRWCGQLRVDGQRPQNHERKVALEFGQATRELRQVVRGPKPVGEQRGQRDSEPVRDLGDPLRGLDVRVPGWRYAGVGRGLEGERLWAPKT